MTEEQLANLGTDAETLLNTETFNRTVNTLVDASIQEFLSSKPEDEDQRRKAYHHYQALVDIVSTLKQQVEVRDQIDSKATEEE